ncbi:hypothetical protein [Parabacteroides hominis]|uniref:DUF1351 domain-containing protein n=1 Tax=Parabacteroides hominis TaxID=2763057 RepID=A0ABR7DTA4_9BACT|nr:hypothetical protein [Parabacteroides hominis]MBC5634644.1 hypothetical protein [Parabacteroides hominis]
MDTQANNSLIKVEEFNQIMQSAPATLQRNQASVSACNQAGQALLDTIEAEKGISSDELDAKVSEYLAKTKITVENMNKRRKPLTQLLATVSKSFTSLESAIDIKSATTIPYKLQQARNRYAAKKLAEQKRREEEARRKQMLENEKAQYRSDITVMLDMAYAAYVEKHINALNNMFNRATLATYNNVCRQISETSTNFSWSAFVENVSDNKQTFYMDAETRKAIKGEIAIQKKKDFTERYRFEIEGTKQDLIDKLPSLRKQLEEQEELRRTNAAEAARLEEESKQREAEARKKQEEERKRREEEAKAKAEAEKAAAEVQAAFDFSAANMSPTPTKSKVKKKIQVTNPQGFMQVYQMWFMREGINMSMEDLEKIHKKMITFCEKIANKDEEQIQSAFVKYVDDVTAK